MRYYTILLLLTATIQIMTANTTPSPENQTANPIIEYFSAYNGGEEKGVPFDKISPAHYEEAIMQGIAMHDREIEKITSNPQAATFENTIVAFDRSGSLLTGAELLLSNLEEALGDPLLMDITSKVTPLLSQHYTSVLLNAPLFERIKQVYDSRQSRKDLDAEDIRLIEETYRDFAENGAALKGDDRKKYSDLSSRLSDLRVKFSQNLTNDMKSPSRRLWLSEEEVAGVPESIKNAARLEAEEFRKNGDNSAPEDKVYVFTVYYPSYSPLMKYAQRRDVRERMYKLYNSRNVAGEFDNTEVLREIANIRLEIARLLGYENYAASILGHKMAGNEEAVYSLLNNLRESYYPAMRSELKEIARYAKPTEGDDFQLQSWDYAYWSDKLKNARYSFNDEDLRPYFELENTIGGVLGLATRLYGYTFKENKTLPVYHPDVKTYDVFTKDGDKLGVLYADFYYRPGKAPGAWMTEFRGECRDDNGTRQLPLISIVCNFSKPAGNEPSLLTPYEVETFLHEFGHALHGLSADTKYASLSGTNVYQDFVELFSQFNENYLTEEEYLDGFARHYKTGEKLPKELLNNFIKASQYGAAYACIRQLNFGFLDMAYHTIKAPIDSTTALPDFESEALSEVKIFPQVKDCLISPSLGHIFSGGYAAGYYGYKWAEVLDADAFAAFKEEGIFNPSTAERFRKMLRSGGSKDPMQLYMEFRGRKPSIEALMQRDGIK